MSQHAIATALLVQRDALRFAEADADANMELERKTRAQMKMRERRELRQRDEAAPSLIDEAVPVDVS